MRLRIRTMRPIEIPLMRATRSWELTKRVKTTDILPMMAFVRVARGSEPNLAQKASRMAGPWTSMRKVVKMTIAAAESIEKIEPALPMMKLGRFAAKLTACSCSEARLFSTITANPSSLMRSTSRQSSSVSARVTETSWKKVATWAVIGGMAKTRIEARTPITRIYAPAVPRVRDLLGKSWAILLTMGFSATAKRMEALTMMRPMRI